MHFMPLFKILTSLVFFSPSVFYVFNHVGRGDKIDALKMKYHIPKDPTTIITNPVPPSCYVKIREAGIY